MAQDSAAANIPIGELVKFVIPAGHSCAGINTVGQVSDIQTPNAAAVKVRVVWLTPSTNQFPLPTPAPPGRIDPVVDCDWLLSTTVTNVQAFT